jgi:hypothetical protein
MMRHIAAIAVFALLPVHAWAQQCTTSSANAVVEEIHRQLLNRASSAGSQELVRQLNNGVTVKEVFRQVAMSPEHLDFVGTGTSTAQRQRAVMYVYDHILGRRPSGGEVQAGASTIQQHTVAAMISGAIDSSEYAERFGDWGVPGSNVVFCAGSTGLTARPRGTSGNTISFDRADRNRDGRITVSEWDDTRQAFRSADANRDNVLSREEYNSGMGVSGAVGTSGTSGISRNEEFDRIDSNRNNRIERNEWRDGSQSFNWLDRNGDGWLSRGEVVGRR